MEFFISPQFANLVILLALSSAAGVLGVRKLITVQEARHELKQGSASYLRAIGRWLAVALWLGGTIWVASILGDWHVTGDAEGAWLRGFRRLEILLIVLQAMSD